MREMVALCRFLRQTGVTCFELVWCVNMCQPLIFGTGSIWQNMGVCLFLVFATSLHNTRLYDWVCFEAGVSRCVCKAHRRRKVHLPICTGHDAQ